WGPYTRLFRHRGLSHVAVVGTLTRLI
ncbi:TPA: hypothetical protein DCE37_25720, partial [Candidatus Latescibacteria bacterium]|nr:hypothetical protein [Candidatus Latescibacterota bacterium]